MQNGGSDYELVDAHGYRARGHPVRVASDPSRAPDVPICAEVRSATVVVLSRRSVLPAMRPIAKSGVVARPPEIDAPDAPAS
ncbi:MAG: hypothetical protein ACYDEY_14410 [Acidimicrobiales bacterium]